jgi:hypothetical protein
MVLNIRQLCDSRKITGELHLKMSLPNMGFLLWHAANDSWICQAGQYCGVDGFCYPVNLTAMGLPASNTPNTSFDATAVLIASTKHSVALERTIILVSQIIAFS